MARARKEGGYRAYVRGVEEAGGLFYESPLTQDAKEDLTRDGSHQKPFVRLKPEDVSVRLGASSTGSLGVGLGRVSAFDKKVMGVLEGGPKAPAEIRDALGLRGSRYLWVRLRLLVARRLIGNPSRGMYCLLGRRARGAEVLMGAGSCYVESPADSSGVRRGDLLELSAVDVKRGDLVMESRVVPAHLGGLEPILSRVVRVWPSFVVLEGGAIRAKADVYKVTAVFRVVEVGRG